MYHDFIYRVHHVRANPNYSHAIQKCCDYIELSLDRRIRTADLASLVGYTEYYLTEKFKKETGKTVSSYIREAKVARQERMQGLEWVSTDRLCCFVWIFFAFPVFSSGTTFLPLAGTSGLPLDMVLTTGRNDILLSL